MNKKIALFLCIIYSFYVLLCWTEISLFNVYIVEGSDYFGLLKAGSILQLPFAVIAWIAYFDTFNYKPPAFTR